MGRRAGKEGMGKRFWAPGPLLSWSSLCWKGCDDCFNLRGVFFFFLGGGDSFEEIVLS